MLNKKLLVLIILLISLLSISAISAADNTTNEIINADTNKDSILDENINNIDVLSIPNEDSTFKETNGKTILEDSNENTKLSENSTPGTFSDLNDLFNDSQVSEINLKRDYTYNPYNDTSFKNGVVINSPISIYGNGHTIDGANAARIFNVTATNVIFYEINFKNGNAASDYGGAIYGPAHAVNCTFTDNFASYYGGAIYNCSATNCNFTNNQAEDGGAIHNGNATNCNFYNNQAYGWGGAIVNGSATNCTFLNNTAFAGSATTIGTATNCIFINNTANQGGAIWRTDAINCIFINNTADQGGAIWGWEINAINCTFLNNSANQGGAIYGVIATNCNFTQNAANEGGAIWGGTATNCNFTQNTATYGGATYNSTATNCNFTQNTAYFYGGAISYSDATDCIFTQNKAYLHGGAISYSNTTDCIFTQNTAYDCGAISFSSANNCNFTQNTATYGGAIGESNVTYCVFIKNNALIGGAIYHGNATDCIFINNTASRDGGAIYDAIATNCNFTQNTATNGGAISSSNATNCIFTDNKADAYGGAIHNGSATNCIFTKNKANHDGGAIFKGNATNCKFIYNLADNGGANFLSRVTNCTFINNMANNGEAMYLGTAILCIFDNNEYNDYDIVPANLTVSEFKSEYDSGEKLLFNLTANNKKYDGFETSIMVYQNDKLVSTYRALSGKGWVVNLKPGVYNAVLCSNKYAGVTNATAKLTINKLATKVTAKAVTTTYNVNKYLVITLKDNKGKALSGVQVAVKFGNGAKNYKTDKNGQIKVEIGSLVPKTYTAKISFAGNAIYKESSASVKVVVKKAAPKFVAKAKSFKVGDKTKRYSVIFKDNKNRAIKNSIIYIKVNGKTYSAKTNSKGKATFKLTKLNKIGSFTAGLTFKGNTYYNKLTKNVKITVK